MYWHKSLKLQSIINMSDIIISDIKRNRNIRLYDINYLESLLSFKDALKFIKAYYTNDLLSLEYALIDLKKDASKKLIQFHKRN